ncbi:MAG TPA: hypothetical protein VFP68_12115, partial [Burkholderiaceae bacterium]|nr:hypothetical protein [Burkholderiaceae bacterium]
MRSVEQFIKIPPRQIEAAIAAMRRDRWTRFQAEQWVGLPTGTLAAVVDDQGRWLNQIVMSLAVNHLPPAMLQVFFERINGIRDSLRMQGLEPPAADDHAPVQGSGDVERAQIHLNRPASNEWPSDTRHSAAATISIERTTQREHATSHSRTGPSDTGRALDLPDLNLPA